MGEGVYETLGLGWMKDGKIIGFKEYRIFLWFTIYWLGQTECGDFKESLYSSR